MMGTDMCVPCEGGLVNLRVGAIIMKDGQSLMVGNKRSPEYLYSVGGRIQFGETAEEAVRREVREETGVDMEVDRLGFVHENYFYGDAPANMGKLIYEISFYFYMKVPRILPPSAVPLPRTGRKNSCIGYLLTHRCRTIRAFSEQSSLLRAGRSNIF